MPFSILVIDDEKAVRDLIRRSLEKQGYSVFTESNGKNGLAFIGGNTVDLILVDINMPEMTGLEFMKRAREAGNRTEIVVISGEGTVGTAVKAIKLGAFDFLEKPLSLEKLGVVVRNAIEKNQLERRVGFLEEKLQKDIEFSCLVGNNREFLNVITFAKQMAGNDINLLLTGDSGTGKGVLANAVHMAGPRAKGPFVAINCAAIPETLLESELFGHEKGAFTSAVSSKQGFFEKAHKGTLFLDEIGELSLALQAKILRVIEDKTVAKIGGGEPVKIDCRIISATNRNLEEDIAKKKFREDLYYRLNVVEIKIPALKDRTSDIPLLANHFLKKHSPEAFRVDKDAMEAMQNYSWPGNVRELENVIQRGIVLALDNRITMELLPAKFHARVLKEDAPEQENSQNRFRVEQSSFQKELIAETLSKHNGNVSRASGELGISRQTLHRMIKKHGIVKPE